MHGLVRVRADDEQAVIPADECDRHPERLTDLMHDLPVHVAHEPSEHRRGEGRLDARVEAVRRLERVERRCDVGREFDRAAQDLGHRGRDGLEGVLRMRVRMRRRRHLCASVRVTCKSVPNQF